MPFDVISCRFVPCWTAFRIYGHVRPSIDLKGWVEKFLNSGKTFLNAVWNAYFQNSKLTLAS